MLVRSPELSQCCQSTMNEPWAPVSCWASPNSTSDAGTTWFGFKHVKTSASLLLGVYMETTNVCCLQPELDPAGSVAQTLGELRV